MICCPGATFALRRVRRLRAWIPALCLLLLWVRTPAAEWSPDFAIQGVRGDIHAAVVFENELWVAGSFDQAGKTTVQNVARWDGSAWHWAGALDGTVRALVVHEGVLFAGGSIVGAEGNTASGLAVLRGNSWEPWLSVEAPGEIRDPIVFVLHSTDDALYIGGRFSRIGGEDHRSLAVWRNDALEAEVVPFGASDECRTLAGTSDSLYVGGILSQVGATPLGGIAHWNGTSWESLDGGLDGDVFALLTTGTGLYVGGFFFRPGQSGIRSIARWTGSAWEELDGGVRGSSPQVLALGEYRGEVVVGGEFTEAGSRRALRTARWADESWRTMSAGMSSGRIRAFVSYRGILQAAGTFSQASGHTAYSVAAWNGFWNPLGVGRGMDAAVFDLAVLPEGIVVGGAFTRAGRAAALGVSTWNGSKWTAQDTQFNDWVLTVAGVGDLIAAGGLFTPFGSTFARHVAIRENGAWRAPRGGVAAIVRVLGEYEGELIAGGPFFRAGGRPAQAIARWNGELWNPLAEGLGDEPLAFLVWEGDLLAAGRFTDAGNIPVDYIARWDGRIWSPGPLGLTSPVHDLALWQGQLVAAGEGTTSPESGLVHLWNGSDWSPLGTGFDGVVLSVAPFGDHLVAGGLFRSADGKPAAGLAIWDGLSWSEIPGAVSGGRAEVHDLLVDPQDSEVLWMAGDFLRVGSLWSNYIARWQGPFPTWVWPGDTDNNGSVGIRDLFPIARHWEANGPVRSPQVDWSAETVSAWDPPAAAYADADGSGRVDAEDILVLVEHWARSHRTDRGDGMGGGTSPEEIAQMLSRNLPPGPAGDAMRRVLAGLTGRPSGLRATRVSPGRVALTWNQEQSGWAQLQIIDIQGRVVRTLRRKMTATGPAREDWTGLTDRGDAVAVGVYWARLVQDGRTTHSAKVVWTR